ncbi:MAG: ATP synthase F0 subunit C [Pseudomonadota bacterium]
MKRTALVLLAFMAIPAFAAEGMGGDWNVPFMALALGLAALGGTMAQGKIVSSAMDGISRNPQAQSEMFIPMILGLAFIESLVIFALIYKYL